MLNVERGIRLIAIAVIVCLLPAGTLATVLTSTHYRLDPNVANSFGGVGSSTDYKMVDAGGEAAVGSGSSQSYKLSQGYVSELFHSIQLTVLPSGINEYYPLDTGIGKLAYDMSASLNNALFEGSPSWVSGKIGDGVSLNGTTDYLGATNSESGLTSYSFSMWFKTSTITGGQLIGFGSAQTGNSTTHDRQVYMSNDGKLHFEAGASGAVVNSTLAYNDGVFHQVIASMGSTGMNLYVDGKSDGTPNANTTSISGSGYWRIGDDQLSGWTSAPTSNFFSGTIDEIKVFNRTLSSAEAAAFFSAENTGARSAAVLPNITPGTSQNNSLDAIVRTDAGGYNLAIQENKDLTNSDNITTIPAISGTITSPAAWSEGVTTGLGMTVTGGVGVEGKWGTSPNYDYAAIPTVPTVFHTRTGLSGGAAEKTTIQFRADVGPAQKQGSYSNTVFFTATLKP
ncbi:MAG: LamG domain-containing protein [Candidatus Saccharimonadia bacterium]